MFNIKSLKITEILSIGFVVFFLLFLQQCNQTSKLKSDLKIAVQNQLALDDSIRIIKNKWGEEITIKNVLIGNQRELKELNLSLVEELKRLKGDVIFLQRMVSKIKSDTIWITNTVTEYPDGMKRLSWDYDTTYNENNGRSLGGYSQFQIDLANGRIIDRGTVITKDEIRLKLTTGLTELDDSYQIFVKSDYPGLTINQLDGAIVDKKKFNSESNESSWVVGPQFGVGLGYSPNTRTIGPNVSVGIGITYNLNKEIKRIFKK
jgi:hypothetical protein